NARDLAAAEAAGLSGALLDRLRLTPQRLRGAAEGLRVVAGVPDPVGRGIGRSGRPNRPQGAKGSVPLGVVPFGREAPPHVTVDAAGLCVKSGNALILRGGKEALHSNAALFRILQEGLARAGLPGNAVQMVATPHREAVGHLLRLKEFIDLVIPRGGE